MKHWNGFSKAFLTIACVLTGACSDAADLQRPDPGKKIKVFLFAGQSNMEGRADGNTLTPEDRARLEKAQSRVQLAYNGEPVGPLDVVAPSDEIREIYKCDKIFGPELFFGIALAEAWPDEKILLIKRSAGSTSLYGCWNPDWRSEKAALMGEENEVPLYPELIRYFREVLSSYSPDDYELCGMLWVQGESDRKVSEAASSYGVNLRNLVERVRTDTGHPTLPFLLFEVGSPEVVAGMQECAANTPGVTLLPQSRDPKSSDFYDKIENGHYNCEGQKKLGTRFVENFLLLTRDRK